MPELTGRPEGVKAILAVASGKEGVGKSVIAVNIALALRQGGLAVGLLDADVHGPNVPLMLGIKSPPPVRGDRLQPARAFGLETASIGLFTTPETAVIWRGPMVMKAVEQMLRDVDWGELDCLVIDLPPGTGDAQITLSQAARPDGVLLVTTPSEAAIADVRRCAGLFQVARVPILGLVENMSGFVCPHCGQRTAVFADAVGESTARSLGIEFLGEIPLDPALRRACDNGRPLVALEPESDAAVRFKGIARRVWGKIAPPARDGSGPIEA